jgi:hypothetical protein
VTKKHETEKQRLFQRRLWGNVVGVALRRFSTLSNFNTIITAMKRE